MDPNTNSLSPSRRWLVQRIRHTYHGTMQDLIVRAGEPIIAPPPKIIQTRKLGVKRPVRVEASEEFTLKDHYQDLFEFMDSQRNAKISKLVIQDGLPYIFDWEEG